MSANRGLNKEVKKATDEYFEGLLKYAAKEAKRGKNMIAVPGALNKLNKTMSKLRYLLEENGYEYTVWVEHLRTFPGELTIVVETTSFGTNMRDYVIFREIVNQIDAFDSTGIGDGKVRYYFTLNDMYREVKTE